MAATSRAWVMDTGDGQRVAAGARHVVEYLLAPETVTVPRLPAHCAGLLYWRERYIPIIDFAPLSGARADPRRRAVVLAYQNAPGEPLRYGALLVSAPPVETWVSDDMAATLPESPAALRHVARACFRLDDRAVPILDTRRLFAEPLPAALLPEEDKRDEPSTLVVDDRPVGPLPENEPPVAADADHAPEPTAPGPDVVASADDPATSGSQEPDNLSYCVVIPFATRPTHPAPEPVAAAEHSVLLGYSSSPDGIPEQASPPAGVSGLAIAAGEGDAPSAQSVAAPRSSATLRSFSWLHELERRQNPIVSFRRRWLFAVLAALVVIAVAWLVLSNFPKSRSMPVARQPGPVAAGPSSVPAAPTQPPR